MDAMRLYSAHFVLVILALLHCLPLHHGQKTPFTLCSRIVAIQESAGMSVDAALQTLDIGDADPIGCVKRSSNLGPNNGLQVSACQELSLELQGQKTILALNLEIEDNKGALRAFETDVELGKDGKRGTAVCFQHDVPMGSSDHADDSPRCFSDEMNILVMFVTETCPEALDTCVANWFIGAKGPCSKPESKSDQVDAAKDIPVPDKVEEDIAGQPPSAEPNISVGTPEPQQPVVLPGEFSISTGPSPSLPVQTSVNSGEPSSGEPSSGDTLFIPSDLPDDIDLPGVQTPAPPPSNLLSIDLCLRMFSTTNAVDRSTCTGFGSTLVDPIRCKEDASLFKPQTGIAYTPCAEVKTKMSPGEKRKLFSMTIGGKPGLISAELSRNIQEDRPLCISVDFEDGEDFPGEKGPGCLHPWEPVSLFVAKTCRSTKVCSYHSLMINGGGCNAPRVLSREELSALEEPKTNLIARYGEPGAKDIYGTPDGPKSTICEPLEDDPIVSKEATPEVVDNEGIGLSSEPVITSVSSEDSDR